MMCIPHRINIHFISSQLNISIYHKISERRFHILSFFKSNISSQKNAIGNNLFGQLYTQAWIFIFARENELCYY